MAPTPSRPGLARAVLSFALGRQLARERAATESSDHVRALVRGCQLERSAAVPMYVAHAHVVVKLASESSAM